MSDNDLLGKPIAETIIHKIRKESEEQEKQGWNQLVSNHWRCVC